MKKRYIAPAIKMENVDTEKFCESIVVASTSTSNSTMLGKDRGSRSESDDFDDLW